VKVSLNDPTPQAGFDIGKLVRPEEGVISRRIFADEAIYAAEIERIFGKCWLVLGHVSQIPKPGDYFTTTMGEDPVIVTRQRDGSVRAFLNSCRHRGMRVCLADFTTPSSHDERRFPRSGCDARHA